jgi:Envelope integrity protein A
VWLFDCNCVDAKRCSQNYRDGSQQLESGLVEQWHWSPPLSAPQHVQLPCSGLCQRAQCSRCPLPAQSGHCDRAQPMSAFGGKADIGPLSTFFNSDAVNRFRHPLIFEFLGIAGEPAVMFSLRVAGIASVMAVVASISVMAQTTGTIPPPAPTSQPPLPPQTANQYSSNEIIDAGHHFFGSVSHGLAMVVEKAVSQWGLPNGYILGEEASGAFIGGLRYGDGTLYTRNAGDVRVFWQGPSTAAMPNH